MEKLDLENVRVYSGTKDDVLDAIDLIGQEVYISDWLDFNPYTKDKLAKVIYEEDNNVWCKGEKPDNCYHRYFILAKDAKFVEETKEKKLRPYKDAEELFRGIGLSLGKVMRYREKDRSREYVIVLNGYTSDNLVMLGRAYHTLQELFNYYEYYDNDTSEWKPFGVEE